MYNLAICEDSGIFAGNMANNCDKILNGMKIDFNINIYSSGEVFLADFEIEPQKYNLLFLDIKLDGISGMDTARKIRRTNERLTIVFVTSAPEYAIEGYDVRAMSYLMKPVRHDTLEKLLRKDYTENFQHSFFIHKSGSEIQRIPLKEIIYMEITGRKVTINTFDRKIPYIGKLRELLGLLPPDTFIHCHQSFAINIRNVREIDGHSATTAKGDVIPISRAYLKDVQKAYLSALGGHRIY